MAPPVVYHPPAAAPAPFDGPPGYLDLTVQGNYVWTGLYAPEVRVNGWKVQNRYGRSTVPVAPGPALVDIRTPHSLYRSQLNLWVEPGQVVPVFYAPPYSPFVQGSIGHVRQQRPGAFLRFGLPWLIVGPVIVLGLVAALLGTL